MIYTISRVGHGSEDARFIRDLLKKKKNFEERQTFIAHTRKLLNEAPRNVGSIEAINHSPASGRFVTSLFPFYYNSVTRPVTGCRCLGSSGPIALLRRTNAYKNGRPANGRGLITEYKCKYTSGTEAGGPRAPYGIPLPRTTLACHPLPPIPACITLHDAVYLD